ncbi:MAG TPA: S9 family peptidase [Acidimicrobiales bacterium]|nr:S9 family peptidase [Acidimicrobiales bacterium]
MEAPKAQRRPHTLETHGDVRTDDWHWLRERENPEVIAYLEAENAYTDAQLAHLDGLRETLFQEFKARIQETDESPPVFWGGHWYSSKTVEGLEYEIHVRRTGSIDGPETVLIDENELGAGKEFFELRAFSPSPDHSLLAYGVNFDGSDDCDILFRDIERKRDLDDVVSGTHGDLEWANDNRTVFYVTVDPALRPHQVWRRRLGDPAERAQLLYEEPDERFRVHLAKSRSGRYLFLSIDSSTSNETWYLDADAPDGEFVLIEARQPDLLYSFTHHEDRFLVTTNADGAVNFKLCEAPLDAPQRANWKEILPERRDARLLGASAFKDFVVLSERGGATKRLRLMRRDAIEEVEQPEEVSSAHLDENPEYDTKTLRYAYTSMVTPHSIYDLDVETGRRTLVKQQPVLGGFDPANYRTERAWAGADDGTQVPISIVYRPDRVTPGSGENPCLLYAYGSYEISIDPSFSPFVVSLLDRGVVYAIAHPRGGGEMGRYWYEDGKFLKKRNTFTDFIAAGDHMVKAGWTAPERMVAMGGSAGGLLMGAVVNLRPDLFAAGVLALVPFVDVVTTMLDETIPLTVPEFEEWGNPKDPAFYEYMKSYSPYDNVEAKDYPPLLVTTGINDTRVAYWEPAKWVSKLRVTKTDDNPLLLKTELGAGHGGPSGRYNEWRERALYYAWALDRLGIKE